VNDGLLVRKQGKGTFVSEESKNIIQLTGSINDLITDGLKAQEVKVLSIDRIKPPRQVAKSLKIKENEYVIRVRRTRNTHNCPISYIINYLPSEIGENIREEDLCKYPMLQILRDQLKIPLHDGIQYIEPIVADYDIASTMSVSICSPILCIETTIFAKPKRPIEFVRTYIRPDRYRYSVKLNLKKTPANKVRTVNKE